MQPAGSSRAAQQQQGTPPMLDQGAPAQHLPAQLKLCKERLQSRQLHHRHLQDNLQWPVDQAFSW